MLNGMEITFDWSFLDGMAFRWISVLFMLLMFGIAGIKNFRFRKTRIANGWKKFEFHKNAFAKGLNEVFEYCGSPIWSIEEEQAFAEYKRVYYSSEGMIAPPKNVAIKIAEPIIQKIEGQRFGITMIQGQRVPVVIPELTMPHHYLVGATGRGKSTAMNHRILQRIHNGDGIAVLVQAKDQMDFIVERIPDWRWQNGDVAFIDASGEYAAPASLNLVADGKKIGVDNAMSTLKQLWANMPDAYRATELFKQGLFALENHPGATLRDVEKMIDPDDEEYRNSLIPLLTNPEVARFWSDKYPKLARNAASPLLHRLSPFLSDPAVRKLVCNPEPSMDFRKAMDERRILLANLSEGVLGAGNTELIGQLVMARLHQATMSRADNVRGDYPWFYIYLDEFQKFLTDTTSYEEILTQARKYRVDLTLAHQNINQITPKIFDSIRGNVGTITCFSVGPEDAVRMSKIFLLPQNRQVDPRELQTLKRGEAWVRVKDSDVSFKLYTELWGGRANGDWRRWQKIQPPRSPFVKGEGDTPLAPLFRGDNPRGALDGGGLPERLKGLKIDEMAV